MTFSPAWAGFAGVFGGRVIAELGAAAVADPRLGEMSLVSLVAQFSAAIDVGRGDVEVEVTHVGRASASVSVRLVQERLRASAEAKLVRSGDPSVQQPWVVNDRPEPDEIAEFEPPYGEMAYADLVRIRVIDHKVRDGLPSTRCWVSFDEAAAAVGELDPAGRAAALLDVVPPGPFFTEPRPSFVPTIDFALNLAPSPPVSADGWYYTEATTLWRNSGYCAESTTPWTSSGEFVARGTQNRRIVG
ncbi:thioesterase family protein [Nocardioides sp. Bht2]|uniref:thioesterase family protein n=1 Tax=Nocardioides sp. Bht2 TaxID=3392297 RepID=UPI0039B5AE90